MFGSPQPSSPIRRAAAERLRRLWTGTALNRALLVALVVALVAGVGLGTGYTTSKAAFSAGVAFLPKDDTVARINAISNQVDAWSASKLAKGDEKLEVVEVRPDSLWIVNHDTATVTPLPTDTLVAGKPIVKGAASRNMLKLVAGGGQTYLLDMSNGRLEKLDGSRGRPGPIDTPAIRDAVADSGGKVWAYTTQTGELLEIVDGELKERQSVGDPAAPVILTMASDLPVLYWNDTGQASMYGSNGVRRILHMGVREGLVSQPSTTSSQVAVVEPGTGRLVIGDFRTENMRSVTPSGLDRSGLDRPVLHHGRVYVPDFANKQVMIVEAATGRFRREAVPGSPTRDFQITTRDDRVWVNDRKSRITLSFDANGKRTEIDSGDRGGVKDEPLPSPSSTPSVTRTSEPPRTPQRQTPPTSVPTTATATPKPRSVVVPSLINLSYEEACERLRPELRCVKMPREQGTVDTGIVMESEPEAGARVPRSSPVTIYYRGPLTVPDFTNMTADKACETLEGAGLRCVRQPAGTAVAAADLGKVQNQNPKPNSPVSTGATVTIQYPDKVAVGTYKGLPVADACAAVQQAGLKCDPKETGTGVPSGVVQSQSPDAGTGVAADTAVTLNYLGNPPEVPSVVGLTPDEACAKISAAHLECARAANAATLDVNKVTAQNPAPGTRHAAGTAVTIAYQAIAPVPLNRFKAPGAKRGNFLSPGGGPAGWSQQSTIGRVYSHDAVGKVDGLQVINQSHCENACGEVGGYYFSANPNVQANWVWDGPAFACFAQPVPGTVPLRALFNPTAAAWAWAPEGSSEFTAFAQGGFGSQYDFTVCHVWPRP